MALDLSSYQVTNLETSSHTKFNNMLTAVQNYANGLIEKAIADAKGDLIAATASDTVTRLAVGSNDQVLTAASGEATGLKWALPLVPLSLTTPGSPVNGQEFILTDSLTAPTYYWLLKYNSTTTKWHFIGGPPIFSEVVASENTTSNSYAALATAGPSITLPYGGDYIITWGADISTGNATDAAFMSYDIGGTGAVDLDAVNTTNVGYISASRTKKKTGLTAVGLTAKYKTTNSTSATFQNRFISAVPIRIS